MNLKQYEELMIKFEDAIKHYAVDDIMTRKMDEIIAKHSMSECPFTDFLSYDMDYKAYREASSIINFYLQLTKKVAAKHQELVFVLLDRAFVRSLKEAKGAFILPHLRGLSRCHYVINDYIDNLYNESDKKVCAEDVDVLMERHKLLVEQSIAGTL